MAQRVVVSSLELSKAYPAHGVMLTQFDFVEPIGGDLTECGYPMIIGSGGGTSTPDAAIVAKLIARLAQVPPSTVAMLSWPDWNAALGVVLGFFGVTVPTSSTDILTPAPPGAT